MIFDYKNDIKNLSLEFLGKEKIVKKEIDEIYDFEEEINNYKIQIGNLKEIIYEKENESVKILEDTWVSAIDEQAKLVDFYEQVRIGADEYANHEDRNCIVSYFWR